MKTMIAFFLVTFLVGCGVEATDPEVLVEVKEDASEITVLEAEPNADGELVYTMSSSDAVTTISAAKLTTGNPLSKHMMVEIPVGALNLGAEIKIFETSSIVAQTTPEALGLDTVVSAGPAMIIKGTGELSAEITVGVPYKLNIQLLGKSELAVMLLSGKTIEIFSGDRLAIEENVVKIKTKKFGAFQAIEYSGIVSAEPIATELSTEAMTSVVVEETTEPEDTTEPETAVEPDTSDIIGVWDAECRGEGWIEDPITAETLLDIGVISRRTYTATTWSHVLTYYENGDGNCGGSVLGTRDFHGTFTGGVIISDIRLGDTYVDGQLTGIFGDAKTLDLSFDSITFSFTNADVATYMGNAYSATLPSCSATFSVGTVDCLASYEEADGYWTPYQIYKIIDGNLYLGVNPTDYGDALNSRSNYLHYDRAFIKQ